MAGIPQDLLLDLYAGVTESARWQRMLDRVCGDLGVRSAVVQRIQMAGSGCFATRWQVRDSYSQEHSALHDEIVADAVNPRMRVEGLPPRRPESGVLRDSDYPYMKSAPGRRFQEALRDVGLGEYLSGSAGLPGGDGIFVVLHRGVDDRRGYDRSVEEYVRQLATHLRQAMVLCDAFEAERSRGMALGAVVDRMRFGVVTCDALGGVRWMSQQAEQLLASRGAVKIRDGRLLCVSGNDTARMRRMIGESCSDAGARHAPGWETLGAGTPDALHVMAVPLAAGSGEPLRAGEAVRVALFLGAPDAAPVLDSEAVGRLLGLTPAEARLTAAICAGSSVKDYARSRGLAEGTVRFQLKQVLAKTGSARQVDLVRRVCSSMVAGLVPARS